MNAFETALGLLPEPWQKDLAAYGQRSVEEIRLRAGRRPAVIIEGKERFLSGKTFTEKDLLMVLERATEASLHTAAGAMREGYLNYRGLRIGVCGNRFPGQSGYRSFNSLAIRIPGQYRGICDGVLDELLHKGFGNLLVAAPPGVGKTTALRELIRGLSDRGFRVGVVDERNELAAYDGREIAFDLGERSDVLTGVSKAEGAMMLLRGMNPQIIAMDEISREQDWAAIEQICGCGIGILASVHGGGRAELEKRVFYRRVLDRHLFSYLLEIRLQNGKRSYQLEALAT